MNLGKATLPAAVALTLATSAMANDFDLSLHIPDNYYSESDKDIAQEVVGFYRQISVGNEILTRSGVNITLVPAAVIRQAAIDGRDDVWLGQSSMGLTSAVNVGDFGVGVFNPRGSTIGWGDNVKSSHYTNYPNQTRHATVAHNIMLNIDNTPTTLVHEVLHSIGAKHEGDDGSTFNDDLLGRTDGHGGTCNNGKPSLMHSDRAGVDPADIYLTGSPQCNGDAGANMVAFANAYAPLAAAFEVGDRNANTVTLNVSENVNNQQFEFVATRTNVGASETMTMYIASGDHADDASLAAISMNFQAASATSDMVTVDFSELHPLFQAATTSSNSTYAVVVGASEVQNTEFDILTVNTAWTPTNTGGGSGSGDAGQGGATGGGSGGSAGLLTMLLLGGMAWRRNRNQ